MNMHIFHEEIGGGYALRQKITVDTSEIEPGRFETMAMNGLGDELDVATSGSREEAERDFRAMIQRHAGPLQAAFYRAALIPGKRYTLVGLSEFGFPASIRMTFKSAKLDTYAQYDDAVNLTFTPYRSRQDRRMFLYNCSFLIYEGWRELDPSITYNTREGGNGVIAMVSKYNCFDERFMDDIKAVWPDYLVAYDHDRVRRSETGPAETDAQERDDEPRKPYTPIPGVTVVFDAEGIDGPCVDVSPEDFARLYAPQDGDDPAIDVRLRRALYRAVIASMKHIEDDDGGTCNFDAPALDFSAFGMTKSDAENVIRSIGLHCFDWKPFKNHRGDDGKIIKAPVYLVISGFQCGQGHRHTHMAEAFCKSMNSDDFETRMYYQMD